MGIFIRRHSEQFFTPFAGNLRRLFFSNSFEAIAAPLSSIFVGAFIWRTTGSLIAVAVFSLGQFALQPFVFGLNGLILRRVNIRHMFFLGAICAGIGSVAVAVFGSLQNPLFFLLGGFLKAVGHGFYFPNRNYLELQETSDSNRNYFFGFIHAIAQAASVVIPFFAGWFIVFGSYTKWYSPHHAYLLLFGVSFLLMVAAGSSILGGTYVSPIPARITRFSLQRFWNERRTINFAVGFVNGLGFISPLLILIYLGNEGLLGTATAIAGIIAAVAMYAYGRFANRQWRYFMSLLSSIVFVACAAGLILLPQPINVIVYVLIAVTASDFFSLICSPILLACSDKEMDRDEGMRYTFIFDNELFLNSGRVCGILLVIGMTVFVSQRFGLLYGPLFAGLVQLAFMLGLFISRKRSESKIE